MKRITGSFFDVVHHNAGESDYWHDDVVAYREAGWLLFMEHMRDSGLDTVILIGAVSRGRSVFPGHPFLSVHDELAGFDPVEAALAGADAAGLHFNMGLGFQESYSHEIANTPEAVDRTLRLAETLLERYGEHPSFGTWYIADEFGFNELGCFNPEPTGYVEAVSRELDRMTPHMRRMISPYFHTNCAVPDADALTPQLERMGVHTVSVQNGANRPEITEEHFVNIRRAFDRVEAEFWGNVELFAFEHDSPDHSAPLIPGPFERILTQIAWIEPYADKLISYQLMGLMNDIGLGRQPEAAELWRSYMAEFAPAG